jgi:hypothetical protein
MKGQARAARLPLAWLGPAGDILPSTHGSLPPVSVPVVAAAPERHRRCR